jgi:hypothetical protein
VGTSPELSLLSVTVSDTGVSFCGHS